MKDLKEMRFGFRKNDRARESARWHDNFEFANKVQVSGSSSYTDSDSNFSKVSSRSFNFIPSFSPRKKEDKTDQKSSRKQSLLTLLDADPYNSQNDNYMLYK